ncbi:MAG: 50S ribosomal protein L11 methyltransferase [Bryobacteraceae bacterium]
MFSLELRASEEKQDFLIADLWELGSEGIVECVLDDGSAGLRAFVPDTADADALCSQFAPYSPRIERHEAKDWVAHSRAGWEPFLVGDRFYLIPEWRDDPAPPGRIRIEINPGLACGTGAHEATQLCLEALERYLRAGIAVLDIGAGTGILSVGAKLLGAGKVIACDLDPVAIDISAGNFQRAGVAALLFNGSADAVADGVADLIVANISANAAIYLMPDLLRCLTPGGRAIASGFELPEREEVEQSVVAEGGVIEERFVKNGWCALAVIRKPD